MLLPFIGCKEIWFGLEFSSMPLSAELALNRYPGVSVNREVKPGQAFGVAYNKPYFYNGSLIGVERRFWLFAQPTRSSLPYSYDVPYPKQFSVSTLEDIARNEVSSRRFFGKKLGGIKQFVYDEDFIQEEIWSDAGEAKLIVKPAVVRVQENPNEQRVVEEAGLPVEAPVFESTGEIVYNQPVRESVYPLALVDLIKEAA